MEGYGGYPYPPTFPPVGPLAGDYPDHGDGFGECYELDPLNEPLGKRRSRSNHRIRKSKDKRSRSNSLSRSRSRSNTRTRSNSRSRSRSCDRTRSKSRTESHSRSRSHSRRREIELKAPKFLDAFRVLYLKPRKNKRNTSKYLATKKRQDRIQELLKSDGLGSKRWLFYPRVQNRNEQATDVRHVDNCDQRIKVDRDFFRKYKRSKKVDSDAPIAKLKRWEILLYKKLGFINAVK